MAARLKKQRLDDAQAQLLAATASQLPDELGDGLAGHYHKVGVRGGRTKRGRANFAHTFGDAFNYLTTHLLIGSLTGQSLF